MHGIKILYEDQNYWVPANKVRKDKNCYPTSYHISYLLGYENGINILIDDALDSTPYLNNNNDENIFPDIFDDGLDSKLPINSYISDEELIVSPNNFNKTFSDFIFNAGLEFIKNDITDYSTFSISFITENNDAYDFGINQNCELFGSVNGEILLKKNLQNECNDTEFYLQIKFNGTDQFEIIVNNQPTIRFDIQNNEQIVFNNVKLKSNYAKVYIEHIMLIESK